MDFFRNASTSAIESVVNFFKQPVPTPNSKLKLTETCETVIDAAIQKKELGINDTANSFKDHKGHRRPINVVKEYIAEKVVKIRKSMTTTRDTRKKEDKMKEYQNQTDLFKNMKLTDFSTKKFDEWQ